MNGYDDARRLRHESNPGEPEHNDGREGEWTRRRRIEMNERFREPLTRALRHGDETAARPLPPFA